MFGKHQIRDNIDIRNLVQDSQKKKKQNNTKQRKKNKRHQFSGEN